eukprot:SAG11_NODE_1808_length_4225_cov_4.052338_2_plen_53_part_00
MYDFFDQLVTLFIHYNNMYKRDEALPRATTSNPPTSKPRPKDASLAFTQGFR